MSRLEIAGSALKDCARNLQLWLVQFFANIILFALFAAWLRIPVSSAVQLIFNFVLILILIAATLILHAGTLNYVSDRRSGHDSSLLLSFRRGLRHVLAVAVCVAVIVVLWWVVSALESLQANLPAFIRSMLPAFLRRHVTLPALDTLFSSAVFVLRWIVVPGFVLPFLLQAADRGFGGFNREGWAAWKRAILSWTYWLVLVAAALIGVFATQALMAWTPDFRTSTFGSEAFSLTLRLTFSYLLGLFAWMLTCSSVGRHAAGGTSHDVSGNPAA